MSDLSDAEKSSDTLGEVLRKVREHYSAHGIGSQEPCRLNASCDTVLRAMVADAGERWADGMLGTLVVPLLAREIVLEGDYYLTTSGALQDVLISVCVASLCVFMLRDEFYVAEERRREELVDVSH